MKFSEGFLNWVFRFFIFIFRQHEQWLLPPLHQSQTGDAAGPSQALGALHLPVGAIQTFVSLDYTIMACTTMADKGWEAVYWIC